jgi:hypothetical protein
MSCKHCHDLCKVRRLLHQEGLDHWLAEVRGALADGTLQERPLPWSRHARRPPPFDQVTEEGPWPEAKLKYDFQCHFCGEVFELRIDEEQDLTDWRPRDPAARYG